MHARAKRNNTPSLRHTNPGQWLVHKQGCGRKEPTSVLGNNRDFQSGKAEYWVIHHFCSLLAVSLQGDEAVEKNSRCPTFARFPTHLPILLSVILSYCVCRLDNFHRLTYNQVVHALFSLILECLPSHAERQTTSTPPSSTVTAEILWQPSAGKAKPLQVRTSRSSV